MVHPVPVVGSLLEFVLSLGIAGMLRLPKENVRCIHVEGSGCYGHNGADDAAGDAALIARAYPNVPVRVQWTREAADSQPPPDDTCPLHSTRPWPPQLTVTESRTARTPPGRSARQARA